MVSCDIPPPSEEAGASWDVPTIAGIITKLSSFVQWFLYYFIIVSFLYFSPHVWHVLLDGYHLSITTNGSMRILLRKNA